MLEANADMGVVGEKRETPTWVALVSGNKDQTLRSDSGWFNFDQHPHPGGTHSLCAGLLHAAKSSATPMSATLDRVPPVARPSDTVANVSSNAQARGSAPGMRQRAPHRLETAGSISPNFSSPNGRRNPKCDQNALLLIVLAHCCLGFAHQCTYFILR